MNICLFLKTIICVVTCNRSLYSEHNKSNELHLLMLNRFFGKCINIFTILKGRGKDNMGIVKLISEHYFQFTIQIYFYIYLHYLNTGKVSESIALYFPNFIVLEIPEKNPYIFDVTVQNGYENQKTLLILSDISIVFYLKNRY